MEDEAMGETGANCSGRWRMEEWEDGAHSPAVVVGRYNTYGLPPDSSDEGAAGDDEGGGRETKGGVHHPTRLIDKVGVGVGVGGQTDALTRGFGLVFGGVHEIPHFVLLVLQHKACAVNLVCCWCHVHITVSCITDSFTVIEHMLCMAKVSTTQITSPPLYPVASTTAFTNTPRHQKHQLFYDLI